MKYGFIGCGNMGGAIASALSKATRDVMLSDRSGKGKHSAEELGVSYGDPLTVAKECQIIFLCVKPQNMESVLAPLQPVLQERKPVLVSIAAGLTLSKIEAFAGCALPVLRLMPNTPVAVEKGLIPYCRNALLKEDVLEDILTDLRFCGTLDSLEESLIDAASALSGCGPAYMYLFIEALVQGAAQLGLPKDKAISYAAATMAGAAEMVLRTGKAPEDLRAAVCSPGGSTLAGLAALEEHAFRETAVAGIHAAYKRTKELGNPAK